MKAIPPDLTAVVQTNRHRAALVLAWLLSDARADDDAAMDRALRLVSDWQLPETPAARSVMATLLLLKRHGSTLDVEIGGCDERGWVLAEVKK